MKDILASGNIEILAQFAWSNVMLGFDFDGTLAPIVDDPEQARMAPRTRGLLERLCKLYPCVIISGRAQADVLKRVRGVGIKEVIGNHGLEPWRQTDEFAAVVRTWLPKLERELSRFSGVTVEDKMFSVAVHYRHCREKKSAKEAILKCAEKLGPLRVIGGEQVINLLPDGAPHKGIALKMARERLGCDTAIYVGDDETDEDVFGLDEPGRLLTIRIAEKRASRAEFFISRQADIDLLLEVLLSRRPSQAHPKTRVERAG